ncbi:uncharacterized protein LOC121916494 isoform X2 [Sceloporus undulatus]|uniref:uncharacterized protein LOC121916494 isoform X2 n=1 Tax=Sceloporus undulatus TaxID=8520 RepID=UPI001C4C5F52|nr:uncharacterized protein LOC121916494 isoform X2 [Sceloporus undulatus]
MFSRWCSAWLVGMHSTGFNKWNRISSSPFPASKSNLFCSCAKDCIKSGDSKRRQLVFPPHPCRRVVLILLGDTYNWRGKAIEMAVGSDPRICLSFLYKNDPFYSFYLSDLLSAPQQVRNKFLKEQKDLTVTLGKLEHQKLSRLRQLDEEKKHFRLLMIKKLAPKVTSSRGSSSITEPDFQTTVSSVQFSSLELSKSSWKSLDTKLYTRPDATFFSTARNEISATHTPKFCKVPGSFPKH